MLEGLEVLVVEPDPRAAERLDAFLSAAGARVGRAEDAAAAWLGLCGGPPDAAVVASPLPDVPALDVVRWARLFEPVPDCVLMCAAPRLSDARAALCSGARGYLPREGDLEELAQLLGEAADRRRPRSDALSTFVGVSAAAEGVRREVRAAAAVDAPVLLCGETGVGKDVLARALHGAGPRAQGAFVPVNCAALPEALLEAELFGAERGAYTGADRTRVGLTEAAAGGTLFLDEVGELSASAQARLLRFLDGGRVRRVGSTDERRVDARIVAASHRDLHAEVRSGRFRQDLLFRLDVVRIEVPPLRERIADLPVLARHLAERIGNGVQVRLDAGAVRDLLAWHWPGNGRELAAVLQRAVVRQGSVVRRLDLPRARPVDSGRILEELLLRHAGALPAVAGELGVSVRTVQRRLARAGLRAAAYRSRAISIASDM